MRRRAIVGFIAVLAASALVVGMSVAVAGAKAKPPPLCAGKTKAAAFKAIKVAYDHFLNGQKFPDAPQKEPYIEHLSPPGVNAELVTLFEDSATKNADSAKLTNVKVNKITCAGKKKANVDFTLIFNGAPLEGIAPADAAAVLSGKTWKVTDDTLCNLTAAGDASVLESGPCYDVITGP
ncbi:MAG TPA: hypothetical protein VIH82_01710 [Acidimicrobiia bacterium]|jgi:hypothetical protein